MYKIFTLAAKVEIENSERNLYCRSRCQDSTTLCVLCCKVGDCVTKALSNKRISLLERVNLLMKEYLEKM